MTTPPEGGGSGLVAKVGGPRNAAVLGAGASVAVVALIAMRRNKATTAQTVTTSSSTDPSSPYDSGPYDMWNAWQQEYEGLQNEITAQQAGQTTASGPGTTQTPPPAPPPVPIAKPPVPTPAPTPKPPAPTPRPPATHTYVVQHGDTLSGIAARNHISMATLKKLNPVYWTNPKYKNGNLIWAGDKVVI
jgi:LysM repeat protein